MFYYKLIFIIYLFACLYVCVHKYMNDCLSNDRKSTPSGAIVGKKEVENKKSNVHT